MSVVCDSTHSVAMSASQTKLPARLKKKQKNALSIIPYVHVYIPCLFPSIPNC
jgi:hypothetical protein